MKIIFLDVDGVLNSKTFLESRTSRNKHRTPKDHLDPQQVKRLQKIVDNTGAKIVVSSTWRYGTMFRELLDALKHHGFTGEIIGRTKTDSCSDCLRGNQILRWVRDHVKDYHRFGDYVILDDDSDMLYWQKDNFVHTSWETGLTDKDVDLAINILNTKSFPANTRVKLP